MRLTIRILGTEVFAVDTGDEAAETVAGDATSYPIGFTQSPGDQAWEQGVER